jgi:predicted Zn finger-like uncharacterized protein
MRHTCEHCQTAYEIPDHRVAGKFLKVRCQACHQTMHVVGLRVKAGAGEQWWCAIRNLPKGPFTREEVLLFVDLGDVSARTRMWTSGMAGWERVCESPRLGWVYARVVERLSDDELLLAKEPTRTYDPFQSAALLSDGAGWFPDPTMKSGIFMLDEATQQKLEHLSRTGVFALPAEHQRQARAGALSAVVAAAAGAAMAVAGFVWLVAENIL